jgi:hypothetical protein
MAPAEQISDTHAQVLDSGTAVAPSAPAAMMSTTARGGDVSLSMELVVQHRKLYAVGEGQTAYEKGTYSELDKSQVFQTANVVLERRAWGQSGEIAAVALRTAAATQLTVEQAASQNLETVGMQERQIPQFLLRRRPSWNW